MRTLGVLLENNRQWSQDATRRDPEYFQRLGRLRSPRYLWIGCCDSRLPPNQLVGLEPGEVFVHCNVANLVTYTDLNSLSVVQYAVDVLQVEHIIVCGHYGCPAIQSALSNEALGLVDNWLRRVQDIRDRHWANLQKIADTGARGRRLCELNVVEQVANVCRLSMVEDAWTRGQPLAVHGWIYGLTDGRLRDLNMCVARPQELPASYRLACGTLDMPRHAAQGDA
jgi:carbonic anhydrase